MAARYQTVATPSRFEDEPIKGSRFVADVAPAATPDAALAVVEAVRRAFPDARHHCFAWRLDPDGRATRASDDGEPGNSAGAPILRQIEGHDLAGVVVVVTRWFGGVKLGVGGLIRAYGGAAGRALDRARVIERAVERRLAVEFPYACSGPIEGALARHGATVERSDWTDRVRVELRVPVDVAEALLRDLRDGSAGRARIEALDSSEPT